MLYCVSRVTAVGSAAAVAPGVLMRRAPARASRHAWRWSLLALPLALPQPPARRRRRRGRPGVPGVLSLGLAPGVFSLGLAPGVCFLSALRAPAKSDCHHELCRCRTGRLDVRCNGAPTFHPPPAQSCADRRPAERPLAPGRRLAAGAAASRVGRPRHAPTAGAWWARGAPLRGRTLRARHASAAAPPHLSRCTVCHRSLVTALPATAIAVATPPTGTATSFPPSFLVLSEAVCGNARSPR